MSSQSMYNLQRGTPAEETIRLDRQHVLLKRHYNNHLLHLSIPNDDSIKAVADVACGPGSWLLDLATSSPEKRQYVGFDLAGDRFVSGFEEQGKSLQFVQHDCRLPFEEKWRGVFDVVHVRLLVYAMKEADLPLLLRNITSLLRPGGHLQWEEGNAETWRGIPESAAGNYQLVQQKLASERVATGLAAAMSDAMLNSILTTYPFSASKHTQQRLSVRQLSVTDYGATFSHPDDLKTIQIAFAAVVELLMKARIVRLKSEGKDEEASEDEKLVGLVMEELKEEKYLVMVDMAQLVARKVGEDVE